jgi:hypothetical protein
VGLSDTQIDAKIDKRNQARNNKNFNLSDQIRDELAELGIILEDNADATRIEFIFGFITGYIVSFSKYQRHIFHPKMQVKM